MLSARWRKTIGDVRAEWGRLALMVAAVAVSLAALSSVLGAWAVLTREISASYLGTRPATASIELPGGVDRPVISQALARPEVAAAEAREVVLARARVGMDRRPVLLFVIDDFAAIKLNRFRSISGAWPPPAGTVLIERSAIAMAGVTEGERLPLKTPRGKETSVLLSGVVHDPGLAPAWQERSIYLYATRETLALLGESPVLHELRVAFRAEPTNIPQAEAAADAVARDLVASGHPVHEIRVPPPQQHPHQRQMVTILLLLLVFAGLSLVLSSVLVANALASMLARQVREIGVMKTLGATRRQLAIQYATLVAGLGALASMVAVPAGVAGGRGLTGSVANMLNFEIRNPAVPHWVLTLVLSAGVAIPLVFAAVPIARATRNSVRAALDDHGVSQGGRVPSPRLPVALRNILRRPARLALTLGLLATGGALFITALSVSNAWQRNLDKIYETRFYDVEVRLHEPASSSVATELAGLPGVRTLERWGYSPAAFARRGRIDIVRTYPDRGHGSLVMLAPPPDTSLVKFPLLTGRWLEPNDIGGVVLNHVAAAQAGGARVGSSIAVSVDGRVTEWRIVGIVEEVGAPAVVYATDGAYAAALGSGARMLRIATNARNPEARTATIRDIEARLSQRGASIEAVVPFSELRTAIGDHILILVRALVSLAVIFGVVGLLGLASAMGTSIIERTREIGIMKALGASSSRIRKLVVQEALFTSALSWLLALGTSLPLTRAIEVLIGRLGFLAPLPFVVSWVGIGLWAALLAIATLLATLPPVKRASALSVREALGFT